MMRFDCPACGQRLKCQPEWVGRILVCPGCEARIQIPEAGWETAEELDPVAAYQEKLVELEQTAAAAAAAVHALRDAAARLYGWRDFAPAEEAGRPVIRNRSGETLGAGSWLSADALRQLITDWHTVRAAAFRAWNDLPRERRVGLRPPP